MTQVCRQCSRINPADASYCYWDGAILAGSGQGPINAGSAPFPAQFVFPGGQMCRNFDQLATTCQLNWQAAVELLKQGFFASFLGGMGRADLAMAATEAAKFPDADRGLDQLLAKLPTQVLQPPQIKVEPSAVNLGQLPMGTDRTIDIHLLNQGMRLIYGSIASDCKWLTLGEGQGSGQKLFQFGAEATIQVHVKGQHLRAGNQTLEGQLLIESNGGNTPVTIRADVPITPFTDGVLAGSYTPRQIAEKARAKPKEAAALFEKGAIAQWFTQNGWIYPVQGPVVSGRAAVQQFFEALGLAKPPKVVLKTPAINLKGDPGQTLTAPIEVTTTEKKLVYAYAVSDQPWIDTTKMHQSGLTASITLTITVPPRPGEMLSANITVTGNGNQKFQVPLTLTVSGVPAVPPVWAGLTLEAVPARREEVPLVPEIVEEPQASPFAFDVSPAAALPASPVSPGSIIAGPPPFSPTLPPALVIQGASFPKVRRQGTPVWMHLLPMILLSLALLILMLRDLIGKPPAGRFSRGGDPEEIDSTPRLAVFFDYPEEKEKDVGNSMRFGLVMLDPENPKNVHNVKRLTYSHRGTTNSTVFLIDGASKIFGKPETGTWVSRPERIVRPFGVVGKKASWEFSQERVFVAQTVEIVPGEALEITPGDSKRLLDTCLIKYRVENKDKKPHKVGMRVLIDTYIGNNDGVPFTIPGVSGMVATFMDFKTSAEVPDFIQALEEPSLRNPGTIVQMNLRLADKLVPDRVSLTHWPGHEKIFQYEVPVENLAGDSAIVMYWNEAELPPHQSRAMAFTYGLGNIARGKEGKLGITVSTPLIVNRAFDVIAYVNEPSANQMVTLDLPQGLTFAANSAPSAQPVPPAAKGPTGKMIPSPLTWRVRAAVSGTFTLKVETSDGHLQSRKIVIKTAGIF